MIHYVIFYLLKTDCLWRILPNGFSPQGSIYYCFSKWKYEGLQGDLYDCLGEEAREKAGRTDISTDTCIDCQSVKTTYSDRGQKSVNEGKKVKGLRCQILSWVFDLLLKVVVYAVNICKSIACENLKLKHSFRFQYLDTTFANRSCWSEMVENVKLMNAWYISIINQTAKPVCF